MTGSLASVHPELIPEWSEKNLPLTPDKITFGSNKRVWWKGACGHEWETSVKARSKANSERNKPISDWEEWQANTLGAAILLPENLVKQGMYLFSLGEKIECLNKIYYPSVYKRFDALADFLGCSKKALAIRMKQLGLLKKEYLDNPFDLVTVYPEVSEL